MVERVRVVVAAVGPGDSEGSLAADARTLRDAGFEVIQAGALPSAEAVAAVVEQEDAAAVRLVSAGGADSTRALLGALRQRGVDAVAVLGAAGEGGPVGLDVVEDPRPDASTTSLADAMTAAVAAPAPTI